MIALTFPERGRAEIVDATVPICGPSQILTQALYTGITNGTERNQLLGGNYNPGHWPVTYIGYQHVGRVIEVGERVEGFAVGDVVYSDTPHKEINAAEVGPEANTILMPAGVEPREGALFGVASVAKHAVARADLLPEQKCLVVGAGLIGLLTAQLAAAECSEVWIADLDQARLELAAELGVKPIRVTPEAESWEAVRAEGPFDVVFEASGAPVLDEIVGRGWPGETYPEGPAKPGVTHQSRELDPSRRSKPVPRVVMVAGRDRVSYDFNAGQVHELSILHVSHFDFIDLAEVAELVAAGSLPLGKLIKEEIPIAEAPATYLRLGQEPGSMLGTVFVWNGS
ncbi:MAG TPA: zinc-binding alcohol dehydrogenase [Solirubrobacterales bacterium]|nr:zinc-binding alcohol dehydrogenase [Solirubrobacterales bacterium]